MEFRNVRDVRQHPGEPARYDVTLDIETGPGVWLTVPFAAAPGGGSICDAVLAVIAAGEHIGPITAFEAPPAPAPHEIPLEPHQWLYGLERHELYAPLDAAISAITDPARRAALRASVFGRRTYHYADVLALIAANQDVLPTAVAALTPTEVQQMWATTLAEVPV